MSKELMIERIEKAQKEIEAKRETVQQGKFRQDYHFMAETGWINDPNGLIYFKGKYHFFYQFNPYSGFWDCMHWGHAVSEDMIHWEYLPLALAPSEVYDDHLKGGCFSGSAIEHDGKLFLIYTGTCNNGNGFEQAQCIAYSEDGIHFEKYEGNPVITAPEGVPTDLFRDPKVWKHDDTYYVVCGASKNEFAQARLYKSTDMFHWEFVNVLAESRGEWGYMWECPDLFEIDGQQIMTCCPQGVDQKGYDYQNVYQCGYFPVEFDLKNKSYSFGKFQEFDKGFDIYATQTFADEAGRRILIGWMGIPDADYDNDATVAYDWIHALTMPRELEWKDGKILQHPLKEMKDLRKNAFTCELEAFTKWAPADCCFELRLDVEEAKNLELKLREDVTISWKDGLFTLSMGESGRGRKQRFAKVEELSDITIFSDTSAIEIFINNGETVLTTRVYSEHLEQKVELVSREVKGSVHGYELGSFEVEYKK